MAKKATGIKNSLLISVKFWFVFSVYASFDASVVGWLQISCHQSGNDNHRQICISPEFILTLFAVCNLG